MSVVRGRPPGLAGGMNSSSSRYWSSLSAWPDPKSPTSTRSSSVHIEASQPESPPERRHHNRPALVKPTSTPFQNRLLEIYKEQLERRLSGPRKVKVSFADLARIVAAKENPDPEEI